MTEPKIYKMTEEEISNFINTQFPTKQKEKNKYGEVFTSPELINKMLDLFPVSVWKNHELTWLDPSVGAGFFMIFVYLRLMNGLKKWQPDDKKRSKHIIENMLYMVELNKTNCDICKSIFGSQLNIICGNFLLNWSFNDGVHTTFDCIVGNPPFHDDHGLNGKGRRINGGKNKLYERIFLKAYEILKPDGYLSFVVPDNMFAGNGSKSYQILIQNRVPFVSFNPQNESYFHKIQQPVCYFILQKGASRTNTVIEHSTGVSLQLMLEDRPVNPIRNWTLAVEKLITTFVSNERNAVVYNRGKPLSSYKGSKYSVIFTPSKTLQTNNEELAVGHGLKKAIIFLISPKNEYKMDYSGKYGVGPNTFYIPFHTNAEGKKLETFLDSDNYKLLADATKTSRQFVKIAFIEHLKLTSIMGITKQNITMKTKKIATKTKKIATKTKKIATKTKKIKINK
jgi:hypothetical protein